METDSNEVLQERPRRRRYDEAFKRALVEQTLAPGASVARIAREHGINANQLFTVIRCHQLCSCSDPAAWHLSEWRDLNSLVEGLSQCFNVLAVKNLVSHLCVGRYLAPGSWQHAALVVDRQI